MAPGRISGPALGRSAVTRSGRGTHRIAASRSELRTVLKSEGIKALNEEAGGDGKLLWGVNGFIDAAKQGLVEMGRQVKQIRKKIEMLLLVEVPLLDGKQPCRSGEQPLFGGQPRDALLSEQGGCQPADGLVQENIFRLDMVSQLPGTVDHQDTDDGVASEGEEVIPDTDAFNAKELLPDGGQGGLCLRAGRFIVIDEESGGIGIGEGLDIKLILCGRRLLIDGDPEGGDHMRRRSHCGVSHQSFCIQQGFWPCR